MKISETLATADLLQIPGDGRALVDGFAMVNVLSINDSIGQGAAKLYRANCRASEVVDHETRENYPYVIRISMYCRNGGSDKSELKSNPWKTEARCGHIHLPR